MIEKIKKLGINAKEIHYNLSYEQLFEHETAKPGLEGFEKGTLTAMGAVTVDTGRFTGRSAKDKYMVEDAITKDTIWWSTRSNTSGNQPISFEAWNDLKEIAQHELNEKTLYVNDCFCGANESTRLKIRVVSEIAWMSHFVKNMFIRPSEEELKDFEPDWTILHAPKAIDPLWKKHNLHSEVFIAFNVSEKMTVIGGSWYGGEVKKGMFSMMNYFLPQKGIGSFHCSANEGKEGDTAIFFGLSGTGKTTLSTDEKRKIIGDDEHGWDDDGVFNFEGGCYAKCIDLTREKEPEIWDAIKRDALLENVVVDKAGNIDFSDASKTQNTRVSYPIYHIKNAVQPVSKGGHPKSIIFLTYDAFGVLPPVSKLTKDQAMYQFLSGFTAKVAGTEIGVKGTKVVFSPCFGAPFLTLHPTKYAEILGKKMDEHGSNAYLINTGFTKGPYGKGERISLKHTRAILDAIHDDSILTAEFDTFPQFNFEIPKSLPNVPPEILNPKNTWEDKEAYDTQLRELVDMFVTNFKRFEEMEFGKELANCLKAD